MDAHAALPKVTQAISIFFKFSQEKGNVKQCVGLANVPYPIFNNLLAICNMYNNDALKNMKQNAKATSLDIKLYQLSFINDLMPQEVQLLLKVNDVGVVL